MAQFTIEGWTPTEPTLYPDILFGLVEATCFCGYSSENDSVQFEPDQIAPDSMSRLAALATLFGARFACYLDTDALAGLSAAQMGRDLWLTMQGHGSGFWDGDWPVYGDMFTKGAKAIGWEDSPYLGDDGLVYF